MKQSMLLIRRSAFTLVEVVVVLAILVALATVAVTSLGGVQDQSRYQATQQGMQNIEDAILGPANQHTPEGSPLITGFVADMGRLPQTVAVTVNGVTQLQPQELWSNPQNLGSFGIKQAVIANINGGTAGTAPAGDEDAAIYVPCGWRGPYLRLGIGQTLLLDGWGNPYDLLQSNRNSLSTAGTAGVGIDIFRSLGLDDQINTAATNDYNEDLYLNLNTQQFLGTTAPQDYPAVSASDRYHASPLSVTVRNGDGTAIGLGVTVTLKYFGPDPATGKIKVITPAAQVTDAAAPTYSLVFTLNDPAITIGPRILRAYQSTKSSAITQVVLFPGGNAPIVQF